MGIDINREGFSWDDMNTWKNSEGKIWLNYSDGYVETLFGVCANASAPFNGKTSSLSWTNSEGVQAKEQAKQDAEIAELEKQTAKAQAETDKVVAESEAQVKVIEAQAEADANQIIAQSITPELIQMKEAEARLKHGWVEVQGADTVVTNQN